MMSPEEIARELADRFAKHEMETPFFASTRPYFEKIVAEAIRAERPSSEELAAPAAPRERERTFGEAIEAFERAAIHRHDALVLHGKEPSCIYMSYELPDIEARYLAALDAVRALAPSTSGGK